MKPGASPWWSKTGPVEVAALQAPEILERIRSYNAEFMGNTPDEFATVLARDTEKWSRVIRDANIRLD